MTRGALHAGSSAVLRAVALVTAAPGMATGDIPARLALSAHTTAKVLQCARAAGLIRAAMVETHTFGWFPAGPLADAAERQWQAIAKRRAAQRNREGVARLRKVRKAPDIGPALPGKPIRKRVKASEPLPWVCTAPASVFHLGGML
jgi:hypothetical protein